MNSAFHRPARSRLAAAGAVTALTAALTFCAVAPAQALPPVGGDDVYAVLQDTPLTVGAPGFLDNDSEPEGDAFTVHSIWPPAGGSLPGEEFNTLVGGGGFTYYPPTGFTGTRVWTYRLNDQAEVSDFITVTFTITAPVVATIPVAVADAFSVTPDVALTVGTPGLFANDYDTDGDSFGYKFVMNPVGGILPGESLDISFGGGSFVYIPPTGFTGVRTWQYSVQGDDGESALVDIVFTVGEPPAPNTAPESNADTYSVTQGAVLTIGAPGVLGNDTDADGDTLSVASTSSATPPLAGESLVVNGDGSLVYTPPTAFTGTRTWTYAATDGTAEGAPASIVFTVDAPVVVNQAPVPNADAFAVVKDTTLLVGAPGLLINDTDADGDALAVGWTGEPAGGKLPGEQLVTAADGSLAYTPPTGFTGTRVWSYSVFDGTTDSTFTQLTFTVSAPMLPTFPEPEMPGTPTTPSTPAAGGGDGEALASTGVDGAGLAGTAVLAGILVAGGMIARRFTRREA